MLSCQPAHDTRSPAQYYLSHHHLPHTINNISESRFKTFSPFSLSTAEGIIVGKARKNRIEFSVALACKEESCLLVEPRELLSDAGDEVSQICVRSPEITQC